MVRVNNVDRRSPSNFSHSGRRRRPTACCRANSENSIGRACKAVLGIRSTSPLATISGIGKRTPKMTICLHLGLGSAYYARRQDRIRNIWLLTGQ